jgi:hypothetical protein
MINLDNVTFDGTSGRWPEVHENSNAGSAKTCGSGQTFHFFSSSLDQKDNLQHIHQDDFI